MKNTLLILFLISLLQFSAQPQNIQYNAVLMHDSILAPNRFEFDIYVKRVSEGEFKAYGFQIALIMDDSIRNNGILTAEYIMGTSEMNPLFQIPDNPNVSVLIGEKRIFKISAKTSIEGATLISNIGKGTRLGRFAIITSAHSFAYISPNVNWTFNQTVFGYSTKFAAIINGIPVDITVENQANHINQLSNTPIPVELTSFKAKSEERNVILEWITATELSTSKYQIERQADIGSICDWEVVGETEAAGTSSEERRYSFTDKNLLTGKYNYRLKIIDFDGTFEYSEIVKTEIFLPTKFELNQNYPNPFNPTTVITYQLPVKSSVILEIFAITGEKISTLVNEEKEAGYYNYKLLSENLKLSNGIYIYRLSAGDFISVKKMVLLK